MGSDEFPEAGGYDEFLVAPEVLFHPVCSTTIVLDKLVGDQRPKLLVPPTVFNLLNELEQKYGWYVKDVENGDLKGIRELMAQIEPLIQEPAFLTAALPELGALKKHLALKEKNTNKADVWDKIQKRLMGQLPLDKESAEYQTLNIVHEYVACAAVSEIPILLMKSSTSRLVSALKGVNHWLHLIHKPVLVKVIQEGGPPGEMFKRWAEAKKKALKFPFTAESRGTALGKGVELLLGHALHLSLAVEITGMVGVFVVYDP